MNAEQNLKRRYPDATIIQRMKRDKVQFRVDTQSFPKYLAGWSNTLQEAWEKALDKVSGR